MQNSTTFHELDLQTRIVTTSELTKKLKQHNKSSALNVVQITLRAVEKGFFLDSHFQEFPNVSSVFVLVKAVILNPGSQNP